MADKEYGVFIGDEYLARDWNGKLVTLKEETVFETDDNGNVNSMYTTEVLVNPDPSPEEIFLYTLKGDNIRASKLAVYPRLEDN